LVVLHKLLFWIHQVCASGGRREGHEVFLTLGVVITDETCVNVLDYVCGRVSSPFVRRFVFILLHGGGSIYV